MHRRGYEVLLIVTYLLMLAVCVFLNLFAKRQEGDIANIIVSFIMLIIVGVIFAVSISGSLLPTAAVSRDLMRAAFKIEDDAKHTHKFLWEKYKEKDEELFCNPLLIEQYQDYNYEMDRISQNDKTYYKCNIEDYIGPELIDSIMHRELMSQVAGVMTGLGILGTFIGLSLGLQNFNTGSTAEITNSIVPLMDGIKVAFHTSIYGMVFSLVFNFVYKRRLDEAEIAVKDFISVYKKFVMPDTSPDGINRLLELEQQQTDAILALSEAVSRDLSRNLRGLLEPQFDRLNDTVDSFARIATRNQMEQLSKIVDAFMAEMNVSLGKMFDRLSNTVEKTMLLQNDNNKQMQEIYSKNVSTSENIHALSVEVRTAASSVKRYVDEIQEMEEIILKELEILKKQEERNRISAEAFPVEVKETFKIINENLQSVESHFRDSIKDINDTMEKVPGVVEYSFRDLEKGLREVSRTVNELRETVDDLEAVYKKRR